MRADCHSHSDHSDGVLGPPELLAAAQAVGITHLAITDHDNVTAFDALPLEAIPEGFSVMPGIEVTADYQGREVHVLGLGFDVDDPGIRAHAASQRAGRSKRLGAMFDSIAKAGVLPPGTDIQELRAELLDRPMPGRLHLARKLIKLGVVTRLQRAFQRFLGNDTPHYVAAPRVPLAQAIRLIREAGGAAVLAHPGMYLEHADAAIIAAREAGAVGVEIHHRKHSPQLREQFTELATTLGMIPTGGSDFHDADSYFGKLFGEVYCDPDAFQLLVAEMRYPVLPARATG